MILGRLQMSSYEFPENIYPSDITYRHGHSIFCFFSEHIHTKEFFKYFYFRLNADYKKRLKGETICSHVLRNDNENYNLIDINYNFFITVLSEWVEHYSFNKTDTVEYNRYFSFKKKSDESSTETEKDKPNYIRKFIEYKIEFSTRERVLFDFSYSSWLIRDRYKRGLRFMLVQTLLNTRIKGYTYVRNYQHSYKSMTVVKYLAKDLQLDDYFIFVAMSFMKKRFSKHFSTYQIKKMYEMANNNEKIISTTRGINNHIKKLEIDEENLRYCNIFDIVDIEKNRNLKDGKLQLFVKKEEEDIDEIDEIEFEENIW